MRYCCWAEMTSFFYLFYIFFFIYPRRRWQTGSLSIYLACFGLQDLFDLSSAAKQIPG